MVGVPSVRRSSFYEKPLYFLFIFAKTIKFIDRLNDKHVFSSFLSSKQVEPASIVLARFQGVPGVPTEPSCGPPPPRLREG